MQVKFNSSLHTAVRNRNQILSYDKLNVRMLRLRILARACQYSTAALALYRPELYKGIIASGYQAVKDLIPEQCSNQRFFTDNDDDLERLARRFDGLVEFTFGYGSGVFDQAGYTKRAKPQIDMIHVVDDACNFHATNLRQFGSHYSGLKYLGGAPTILAVQQWGGGVYFNPFVAMASDGKTHLLKYGVTTLELCLRDLCEWNSLYVAGRLQKPVKYLRQENKIFELVNQYNLKSALTLALLLAPTKFDEVKLYETITLVSYMGDPRMAIGGENPKKVQNIVNKQFAKFRHLYAPIMEHMVDGHTLVRTGGEVGWFEKREFTPEYVSSLVQQLPLGFRRKLGVTSPNGAMEFALDKKRRTRLILAVRQTVRIPAAIQTLKGVLTAGITKSVKYAWEKNSKWRG